MPNHVKLVYSEAVKAWQSLLLNLKEAGCLEYWHKGEVEIIKEKLRFKVSYGLKTKRLEDFQSQMHRFEKAVVEFSEDFAKRHKLIVIRIGDSTPLFKPSVYEVILESIEDLHQA